MLDAAKIWRLRHFDTDSIKDFKSSQSYFNYFLEIHISLSRNLAEEATRYASSRGLHHFSTKDLIEKLFAFLHESESSGFRKAINVFANAIRVPTDEFLYAVINKNDMKISWWDIRHPSNVSNVLQSDYIHNFINSHLSDLCEYCSYILAQSINKKESKCIFRYVSRGDEEKALSILENLKRGVIASPNIGRALSDAVSLHPYHGDIWREWIDRFGDSDGSVGESAAALHVDEVDLYKNKLISQENENLDWSTVESCAQGLKSLEKLYSRLGLPFEHERKRIKEISEKIERESRTFNGVVYASSSVANAARAADEKAREEMSQASEAQNLDQENEFILTRADSGWGWGFFTLAFRRKFSTSGRSCRREFWALIALCTFMIFSITLIIWIAQETLSHGKEISTILTMLLFLFISYGLLLSIFVQIRRFHDLDKSGFFVLLNLIPYVGWLIVLIMMVLPGTRGDNRYGPDPLRH